MGGRLIQLLLALSLLLNAFFLAGFVYRSWLLPQVERQLPPPATASGRTWVGPLEAMAGDLGLDDKQRQALKDVFEKNHADRRKRFRKSSSCASRRAASCARARSTGRRSTR